jgi:uncharacterized protein (TIGR03083 family)
MTAGTTTPAKKAKTADYRRMTQVELDDLSALLHTFSDEQWDAPTLCEGWKVRHVIGHMCMGGTMSPLALPIKLVPYRFNVNRASSEESFKYGQEHTPTELLDVFDRVIVAEEKPGLGKLARPNEWFVDKLIHQLDIRSPQGLARELPVEHATAALDALPRILSPFLSSRSVCKGLRFNATDLDHSVGDGPEVRGPAEDLILAMSGRPVGLDALDGDGVATLRDRIMT